MKVLLVGSGGREHAIARALSASKQKIELFCFASNSNPGIKSFGTTLLVGDLNNNTAISDFAKEHAIDMAIIGPEAPLANGLVDCLENLNIKCIGPTKKLSRIESSKGFARDLLTEYNIAGCPRYKNFTSLDGVSDFIRELDINVVVKADGLAGGKGVVVAGEHILNYNDVISHCEDLVSKGKRFLIEEKLVGQEFSLMSFSDGNGLVHMPVIQDNKRAFVDDKGPNTGGMGCYSGEEQGLPFLDEQDILSAQKINEAAMSALQDKCKQAYKGILYGGFIKTANGIFLIEYNARFGDPECINLLGLLESDLLEICKAICDSSLQSRMVKFSNQASVCKYVAPQGYPNNALTNAHVDISEVDEAECLYFAAIDDDCGNLLMTGSRAIAVLALGNTIFEAEEKVTKVISKIKGPIFYRADIGTKKQIAQRVASMESLLHESH